MIDIFLDRDGVINHNRPDHVKCWQEFSFLPGALQALASLRQAGYRVFVVTNQALINRGTLTTTELDNIHRQMCDQVRWAGGHIHAVLYCPHRPEEKCQCRKPQPGLLYRAAHEYGANLAGNWLIGDHLNDVSAGQAAGCRPMLVLSGRSDRSPDWPYGTPLAVATDLAGAVQSIIQLDQLPGRAQPARSESVI